jgi:predicted alpha-1,2-mannosidase
MIGYHAVPVIADAYVKGIRGFDSEKALRACIITAENLYYPGVQDYMKYGYVPEDKTGNSASVTLEYAYDDFTISCFARALGMHDIAERYSKRSRGFETIFDPSTGFMRARNSDGSWRTPFDPLSTHGQGFIEGNAWNYSLYVPHDVPQLIGLMGGEDRFIRRLDSLFTMHLDDRYFGETEDVTRVGLIGNYVHGNEPSHHVPYLYNWTGKPWKTQERVDLILRTMYRNEPDGLCGNDDCGQMSAWYLFSALGFYPVCPGTTQYATGAPIISEAVIHLPNEKTLTIKAPGRSLRNIYVKKTLLNGKPLRETFLEHSDLVRGGELVFEMNPKH